MGNKEFERKSKENKPVLAICYDFDKTLSPDDMQAQGYIQSIGYDVKKFWMESNTLAEDNEMDQNLAYMYKMVHESEGKIIINRKNLEEYGAKVKLFPGVADWFERIGKYGLERKVIVEHYIISCGLKEMIEGTSVAKQGVFERIYASSFYYDPRTLVAKWPAQAINYTSKTQFLFRIEKGTLDVNDSGVNDSFKPEELRVPFRNMVYIGDSDTDIPCMKLVNSYGGHSIGVYNLETKDKKSVYKMMRDNRIKFFVPADYSEGTELDCLVKTIIDRTAANEALEDIHYKYKEESFDSDKKDSEDERKRTNLLIALENSRSFANTHSIVKRLNECKDWTEKEKERLIDIAVLNSQVRYVLADGDLKEFYKNILNNMNNMTSNAIEVKKIIEDE